ncbi:nucleosome assembly protein-domain-containing protein [Gilbertella persicaria]|uniref:nucleosome assembly protein-domain-containing protein n=1 Tax=Gilbertella persicaria TaxID=101096 RepID=UPI0022203F30|nr:nucleosome assembly protein-domain-containing protein [Gilbertella persicaria]KAI8086832.1 nucleosome assembly protein-domain-containing protein [Gilbertella persicaria]
MDQQAVDIKNKQTTAPTPQNTPINTASINSQFNPSIPAITEEMETITTPGAAGNPALMSMLQGKLGNLLGEPLPASVQRRINGLKYLQSKHTELEGKFQEEVLALEKKYLELYRPLYTKRAQVIAGEYEPTEEEVALGAKVDEEEEEDQDEQKEQQTDKKMDEEEEEVNIAGIPEFWLTALKTHPQISDTISEEDCEALKHLTDIRMTYLEKPGFRLEFEFTENDFFTDKVLTKTYHYQDNVSGGDYVYDYAEGCQIHWKDGKDLTVTVETKKQRHKGTNKTRVVKRTVPAETFFNFFSPPTIPEDDNELDEEEAEGLDAKLEADYEMGEEFKEKIIPHAVDFFTGKALEYEDYDDEDDFEDDFLTDEDNEEDDDEEEEDDDDDDDAQPTKGENAPECKQS